MAKLDFLALEIPEQKRNVVSLFLKAFSISMLFLSKYSHIYVFNGNCDDCDDIGDKSVLVPSGM